MTIITSTIITSTISNTIPIITDPTPMFPPIKYSIPTEQNTLIVNRPKGTKPLNRPKRERSYSNEELHYAAAKAELEAKEVVDAQAAAAIAQTVAADAVVMATTSVDKARTTTAIAAAATVAAIAAVDAFIASNCNIVTKNHEITKNIGPFMLASCPVDKLTEAIILVNAKGGLYAAGDATDTLNKELSKSESWKAAWKGKTKMAIDVLKKLYPRQKITVIAVAGGPACDWELGELFRKASWLGDSSMLELKVVGDIDSLKDLLESLQNIKLNTKPQSICNPKSSSIKVFLSHAWANDKQYRDNHERVRQINQGLKARNIKTWFDTQGDMKDNCLQAMTNGIDECDIVIVFVTRAYIDKCTKEGNDNCKLEFEYAYQRKNVTCLLPVVMETDCTSTTTWNGPVGAVLGTQLYIYCNEINTSSLDELASKIRAKSLSLGSIVGIP